MKPKYLQILVAAFLLVASVFQANAQNDSEYITLSGEVRDAETKRKMEYVNVSVLNTSVSTVTNTDGVFSIKIKKSLQGSTLVFAHLGYDSQQLQVGSNDIINIKILLSPRILSLDEASIGNDASAIVKKAIGRIGDNYSSKASMLTGFYRETIKKRNSYINISEAITFTYKDPYNKDYSADRVQIYKGRQLLSTKPSDTLMVKLQGGPIASVYMDAAKEWDILADPISFNYYKFTTAGSNVIDGRTHYVINFRPRIIVPYALLYGKMYIDEETLTFTKIEASLSMDDKNKATEVMLKKKPYGLRFTPEALLYEINYKRNGETSYLSYVRTELHFKCDWKRRLFRSNYLIVSEMVTTNLQDNDVAKIPAKLSFNEKYSLSDKVASFYDANFWEDYNIIEPTESLLSAINKLRKKQE